MVALGRVNETAWSMAWGWGNCMGPTDSLKRRVGYPAISRVSVYRRTTRLSQSRVSWRSTYPRVFSGFCAKSGGSHNPSILLRGAGRSVAILLISEEYLIGLTRQ
jgi:hypothetical protein